MDCKAERALRHFRAKDFAMGGRQGGRGRWEREGGEVRMRGANFSNEKQAWKFPKLVEEIRAGRISFRLRIDDNSQRLFVEDVD